MTHLITGVDRQKVAHIEVAKLPKQGMKTSDVIQSQNNDPGFIVATNFSKEMFLNLWAIQKQ